MPVERALDAYQKERLNCAQSILRAFQPRRNIPEEEILKAKQHGGGRAEGGLCGALHAALQLAGEAEAKKRLHEEFLAAVGADKCREIKRTTRVPCADCVRIAATLLAGQEKAAP